ncbi:MAG: hypothetical protein SPI12_05510 [Actinomycetaceae bacterium]|nr:hypothetical protein [Actinomycetaceae bacterium]MDY6083297.1 hypothetical protein [Actinomycetaceae bacterium]
MAEEEKLSRRALREKGVLKPITEGSSPIGELLETHELDLGRPSRKELRMARQKAREADSRRVAEIAQTGSIERKSVFDKAQENAQQQAQEKALKKAQEAGAPSVAAAARAAHGAGTLTPALAAGQKAGSAGQNDSSSDNHSRGSVDPSGASTSRRAAERQKAAPTDAGASAGSEHTIDSERNLEQQLLQQLKEHPVGTSEPSVSDSHAAASSTTARGETEPVDAQRRMHDDVPHLESQEPEPAEREPELTQTAEWIPPFARRSASGTSEQRAAGSAPQMAQMGMKSPYPAAESPAARGEKPRTEPQVEVEQQNESAQPAEGTSQPQTTGTTSSSPDSQYSQSSVAADDAMDRDAALARARAQVPEAPKEGSALEESSDHLSADDQANQSSEDDEGGVTTFESEDERSPRGWLMILVGILTGLVVGIVLGILFKHFFAAAPLVTHVIEQASSIVRI